MMDGCTAPASMRSNLAAANTSRNSTLPDAFMQQEAKQDGVAVRSRGHPGKPAADRALNREILRAPHLPPPQLPLQPPLLDIPQITSHPLHQKRLEAADEGIGKLRHLRRIRELPAIGGGCQANLLPHGYVSCALRVIRRGSAVSGVTTTLLNLASACAGRARCACSLCSDLVAPSEAEPLRPCKEHPSTEHETHPGVPKL